MITETRSTLRDRLLAHIRQLERSIARLSTMDDRNARTAADQHRREIANLSIIVSDPIYIAAFDAWLDGAWEPIKHKLEGNGLSFAAKSFVDQDDAADAYLLYHDLFEWHDERLDHIDLPEDD